MRLGLTDFEFIDNTLQHLSDAQKHCSRFKNILSLLPCTEIVLKLV